MTAEEFIGAVRGVLDGARLCSIGRAAGTGEFELNGSTGQSIIIHIQCPFRLMREGLIVLGSDDMNVSKTADPDAFDSFRTIFDSRAVSISELLKKHELVTSLIAFGEGGYLAITWRDLRLEVFPNSSGNEEAWRVFELSGSHYVYPMEPS